MRRRGQVLILYTLAVPVVLGALGLTVDLGFAHYRRHAAQTAAQAAVLAAVKFAKEKTSSTFACGAGVPCNTSVDCPPSGAGEPTDSFQAGCLYAQRNGFTTAGRQKVTLTSGANGAAPSVPGVKATYWVTAVVSETIPQTFSAVFGKTTARVSARAVAAGFAAADGGGCVYVLRPNGSSVTASGNASLRTGCGVQVNSSSSSSVTLSGNARIETTGEARTRLVGGWRKSGNATISPAPITGAPVVPDPFASLQPPDVGPCTSNGVHLSSHQSAVLEPGVYCGAVTLSGQSSVTLRPGMYVLKNGLSMSGGSSMSMLGGSHGGWDGVTFYIQGGGISLSGGTDVELRAPTSGYYQGILIFQARGNKSSNALSGGASQRLNGAVYFPSAGLTYSGGSGSDGDRTTIVTDSITLSGNAYISEPATTQFSGGSGHIALIE